MPTEDEIFFTSNFNAFDSGEIITHNDVLDNARIWFGFPEKLAQYFLVKTTVEDTNRYLKQVNLPWRVSHVEVVNGMRQWTIA